MKINTLLLMLFSCLLSHAQTTFYVAPTGGHNANPGTSLSPWATLAYAVSSVKSGDIIYLQAGVHSISSQVAIPIGVSITGSGESSIISSSITTQFKATLLLHSSSEGIIGNQSISYIKMTGNGTAWGAIQVNARSNVLIHHCTFVDFFSCGVIFNASTSYAGPPTIFATGNKYYNNISDNCSDYPLADDGQGHVMFGGQDGIEIFNNIMTQTTRELKRNGYLIKFYSYGYSKRFKIYNNTLNRAIGPQGFPYYDFSIETWHTLGGAEIYNNTMTGGIDVGGGITYNCLIKGGFDYGIWIHDNIIGPETYAGTETTGIYLECNTDGAIIERNYFKNQYNGIMVTPGTGQTCKNHIIRYNIFTGIRYFGLRFINGTKGGIVDNIDLYNNIFNAGSTSLVGIGMLSVGKTTNLNIINNIIIGFDYAPMFANGTAGQTMDKIKVQNNILFQNANSNNPLFSSITPTNYVNSGNKVVDPMFFSSSNFHVKAGSPAIKAGIKVSDLLVDFDRIPVSDPPYIGTFETTAESSIPSYSNSVIEDSDPSLAIISYNTPLLNIVPDKTSFQVTVNSIIVLMNSINIQDGKVHIKLETPILFEDKVTISYSVPAVNPLQSVTNVNAAAIPNTSVTNNVKLRTTKYLSSTIEDSIPSLLIISFDQPLMAQVVPDKSFFEVIINSTIVLINSIEIQDGKVHITLKSPVSFGDIVTISYTVPQVNPLKSVTNVLASSMTNSIVINSVKLPESESLLSFTFTIYPNPVKDHFNISISGEIPQSAKTFRISSLNGIVVFESSFSNNMLTDFIYVNLDSGLYIAQILYEDLILYTSKFVVLR